MKKDETYICKKCGKEVRIKSVTETISDLRYCQKCYTKKMVG